jgi:hypothetical protein
MAGRRALMRAIASELRRARSLLDLGYGNGAYLAEFAAIETIECLVGEVHHWAARISNAPLGCAGSTVFEAIEPTPGGRTFVRGRAAAREWLRW